MSRPRKGEKGSDEATAKWKATMLAKYGDEEALHNAMVKIGAKGGRNGHTGGFNSNKVGKDGLTGPERAKICGTIGGQRSRRGPAKRSSDE